MSTLELISDPLLAAVPLADGAKVLGGVRLTKKLGEGGMGAVYRGKHLRLDIDVAVKVMSPSLVISRGGGEGDALVMRFIREARMAAAIEHPGICRVFDVNVENGVYFIVMALIEGEAVSEVARRYRKAGERMPEVRALRIVLGAAEALGEAHRRGIVHRDVKPQNLIQQPDGRVKVIDLGIAKATGSSAMGAVLTRTGVLMGTPAYFSPEQIEVGARDVGAGTDVWALGVTLYQLLTNELPFAPVEGDDSGFKLYKKICEEPAPDLAGRRPDVTPATRCIVERALAKHPAERYRDGIAMATALSAAIAGLDATSVADAASAPQSRSRLGGRWVALVSAGLAAIALLLAPLSGSTGRNRSAGDRLPSSGKAPAFLELLPPAGVLVLLTSPQFHVSGRVSDPTFGVVKVAAGEVASEFPVRPDGGFEATLTLSMTATAVVLRTGRPPHEALASIPVSLKSAGLRATLSVPAVWNGGVLDASCAVVGARPRVARFRLLVDGRPTGASVEIAVREAAASASFFPPPLARALRVEVDVEDEFGRVASDGRDVLVEPPVSLPAPASPLSTGPSQAPLTPGAEGTTTSARPAYLHRLPGGLEIEMVYVPAGEFIAGDDGRRSRTACGYYIGRTETTWRQYLAFCSATSRTRPQTPSWGIREDHPVVNVTALDADAFCAWAGLELPAEDVWEKAARGTDGRKFPWGGEEPDARGIFRANVGPAEDHELWKLDGFEYTAPVGSFARFPSPYGALDMAGNVWEWTSTVEGGRRIVKGGGWCHDAAYCRAAQRYGNDPAYRNASLGFRPAKRAGG